MNKLSPGLVPQKYESPCTQPFKQASNAALPCVEVESVCACACVCVCVCVVGDNWQVPGGMQDLRSFRKRSICDSGPSRDLQQEHGILYTLSYTISQ